MPAATSDAAPPERRGDSLLKEKVPDHHRVDAGRIEAAYGVARRADERFAKQVERRVVENRQPRFLSERVQQLPVKGIVFPGNGMHADEVAGQDGPAELFLMGRAHAADTREVPRVRAGLEVLPRD